MHRRQSIPALRDVDTVVVDVSPPRRSPIGTPLVDRTDRDNKLWALLTVLHALGGGTSTILWERDLPGADRVLRDWARMHVGVYAHDSVEDGVPVLRLCDRATHRTIAEVRHQEAA